MGIRRKVGDIVTVAQGAGFVDAGKPLRAEIMGDGSQDCFLDCGDADCQEFATLWTVPSDPNGKRNMLCHVSECQMTDG